MFHAPKIFMVNHPILGMGEGNNGFFMMKRLGVAYAIVASDGEGWEHISVSLSAKRTPSWEELCWLKNIFWDEEDCVVQYHPAKKDYVNMHPYCLHLWRPINEKLPTPPSTLVGF